MMPKLILLPAIALALSVWSGAATASPPDIIDIQDELFGANPTEIFVLRTVSDNLGTHSNLVSTVFLVSIDAATGEENTWPLHRTRIQPAERNEPGDAQLEILTDPLPDARNPFNILAQRSAVPSGATALFSDVSTQSVELTGQGLVIRHQDGTRHILPSVELFAGLERLTARLAGQMEPYGRPGILGIGDLLADPLLSLDECSAGSASLLHFPADMPPTQIARVTCGSVEDGFRLSVFRVVPAAGQ